MAKVKKEKEAYNNTCSFVNFIVIFFSIGKHCSTSRPFIPKEKGGTKSNYSGTTQDSLKKNIVVFFLHWEGHRKQEEEGTNAIVVLQNEGKH